MAYVLAIEERTQLAQLAVAGVENDPRDVLDEPFAVKSWSLPGREFRPAKIPEPGVPDWWSGDEDASDVFLKSMGVNLQ